MPRTRSLAWSELKVGVITITAIVIAAITIFSLTGSRGFFWQRYILKTRFSNVAGLAVGSPVRVAGKEVGSVKAVEFAGDQIDITFDVNKEVRDKITSGSVAVLGSVSLLGEGAVDISPSSQGAPIPEYGYVPAASAPRQLSDLTNTAGKGLEDLSALIHDIRQGRGTVGKLVTDDQLYAELRRFVTSANDVTKGIQQGRGTIGRLLNDPKAAEALEGSLRNLEAMTRQINSGQGSIGRLLKDDAFSRSLTAATTNLETLTTKLNRGEGTAGKLLNDAALYNRLNEVTSRIDELLNRLNSGQGTAGQLLNNRELYENMNRTVADMRALVADIRKDPKKFLNVKVSIW
jgi:phospholipid/cholesterol/gamma-HCH transport system substrate-binding protein